MPAVATRIGRKWGGGGCGGGRGSGGTVVIQLTGLKVRCHPVSSGQLVATRGGVWVVIKCYSLDFRLGTVQSPVGSSSERYS